MALDIPRQTTISELTPDDANLNKGTQRGAALLERSLRNLGAGRSVLIDKNGKIIAGNKTIETAASIGLEDVLVVPSDGSRIIAVQRTDLDMDDAETGHIARELALADNRVAEVNLAWDAETMQAMMNAGVEVANYFFEDELELLLNPEEEAEASEAQRSDGSLLALQSVTIADPVHIVNTGDRWRVGRHTLFCCNPLTDWEQYVPSLEEGSVLAPYPGPYVPLTVKAEVKRLVMVQPDPYIAGHILDIFARQHGETFVAREHQKETAR